MRYSPRKTAVILLFVLVASLLLVSSVCAAEAAPSLPPAANSSPSRMQVAVFVNSIYNLDMVQGTYSVDLYLTFRWTDPGIETAGFEFMNGEPSSGADSVEKIYENKSGPVKEEDYRVRGDFRVTPNNVDYPYESGILPIEIENTHLQSSQLVFVPLPDESGIEPGFVIPGWKFGTRRSQSPIIRIPGTRPFPGFLYNIPITNDALASLLQTIVPPLIFCIIAGLSFLIRVDHPELVHLRYVLTTSMFISAVMYHFGQLALIPGLGVLKLFDKFMIAVYLFLAVTVTVTTFCYLAQQQWGRPELVRPVNRYGVVVAIILPLVAFWLLMVQV